MGGGTGSFRQCEALREVSPPWEMRFKPRPAVTFCFYLFFFIYFFFGEGAGSTPHRSPGVPPIPPAPRLSPAAFSVDFQADSRFGGDTRQYGEGVGVSASRAKFPLSLRISSVSVSPTAERGKIPRFTGGCAHPAPSPNETRSLGAGQGSAPKSLSHRGGARRDSAPSTPLQPAGLRLGPAPGSYSRARGKKN